MVKAFVGTCAWCRRELEATRPARFCSRKCRQSAFRLRRRGAIADAGVGDASARFAYADPPYPGLSSKYYRHEPTFAGEVDHAKLIASLTAASYAGWALSTSSKSLSDVLPMCPRDARVCAWVKPIGTRSHTYGLHSTWEPLIVVAGRKRRPPVRDYLIAQPARSGGTLPGRKPLAFCAWLFDCLGMQVGDELVDLFPGTGVVSRAWAELSSPGPLATRRAALGDGPGVAPRGATRWLPFVSVAQDVAQDVSDDTTTPRPGVDDTSGVDERHDTSGVDERHDTSGVDERR